MFTSLVDYYYLPITPYAFTMSIHSLLTRTGAYTMKSVRTFFRGYHVRASRCIHTTARPYWNNFARLFPGTTTKTFFRPPAHNSVCDDTFVHGYHIHEPVWIQDHTTNLARLFHGTTTKTHFRPLAHRNVYEDLWLGMPHVALTVRSNYDFARLFYGLTNF
jgi:hypothetical protein